MTAIWSMAASMMSDASRSARLTRLLSPPETMELRKPMVSVPSLLAATDWMPKPTWLLESMRLLPRV